MIKLLDFQEQAANQLAERVVAYLGAPVQVGKGDKQRRIPLLQLLSSITASGKTLILADAVSTISMQLAVKPVVLWLSKASVVVAQSYANLAAGGAYHDLLDELEVRTLADYAEVELRNSPHAFLFFATVGTFNQEKKAEGTLNVFKSAIDDASGSTWESLKLRPTSENIRRPLIIVYDEAHNLSDQQTKLLLELQPDAFLLATATSRLPQRFQDDVIDHLKKIGEMSDADLTTVVDAKAVADSGLIKSEISLVGRQAPMEDVIAEMVGALGQISKAAASQGLTGLPKAVYVCKTNIEEETGERDDPKRTFAQRRAPPILIWRHLVEKMKVEPAQIAVYADLKTDKNFPLPPGFVLFKGGDKDYDDFVKGPFRHIIFNQSLQEGWDDPLVYCAYVDKSMGSKVQAEQVIGRVLRQPGRKHYSVHRLNLAQIYVRVERAGVFDEVVASVEEKIRTGQFQIRVTPTRPGKAAKTELPPKAKHIVPVAAIVTDRAEKKIAELIAKMSDYRTDDGTNTRGTGKRVTVQRIVGAQSGVPTFVWEDYGESAMVQARWLFNREVSRVHKNAMGVALTTNGGKATKFDARVGFGSSAATHIADVARKVGETFVDQVYLKLRGPNPFEVGPVLVRPDKVRPFKKAVHKGYDEDDFNEFEGEFAAALDKCGATWCRNPARSGYAIPLPEPGKTMNFYPDFLVWKGDNVFVIDTKGAHLHADAARKLVAIKPASGSNVRVFVRFVSKGVVDANGPQPDASGYTVWSHTPAGNPEYTHHDSLNDAVQGCFEPDA